MLIDTHCHVDRFRDPLEIASKCEREKIGAIAVTNIPSHYEMSLPHLAKFRYVKPALGFHPMAVAESFKELPLFLSLFDKAEIIGEIGLDFSKDGMPSKDKQLKVFTRIVEAIAARPKFATIHTRGAADVTLSILNEHDVQNCVFHWYSGTLQTLQKIVDAGHYCSVNTAMCGSKKGQEIISNIPKDRILTESDGPYVKVGNREAKPFDMMLVVEHVAACWEVESSVAEKQIEANYVKLKSDLKLQ